MSKIAFTSTRDNPTAPAGQALEIYLMNPDGSGAQRLTDNNGGDGFAALSPDGRGRIVFDSNRDRAAEEPINTSDLFVMNADGSEQTFLIRGSSATWSADGKDIAYHASASGTGQPIRTDPGSATGDSDIFVANVDDLLLGVEQPANVTRSPAAIDDDADWSRDAERIAYTRHDADDPNHDNPLSAEIYVTNADGTGEPQALTDNDEEERSPDWSPDGTRIVFSCRHGGPDFELCLMNADGTAQLQVTFNSVQDLTPTWSPDASKIAFHRVPVECLNGHDGRLSAGHRSRRWPVLEDAGLDDPGRYLARARLVRSFTAG